jgi:hypothetical protein
MQLRENLWPTKGGTCPTYVDRSRRRDGLSRHRRCAFFGATWTHLHDGRCKILCTGREREVQPARLARARWRRMVRNYHTVAQDAMPLNCSHYLAFLVTITIPIMVSSCPFAQVRGNRRKDSSRSLVGRKIQFDVLNQFWGHSLLRIGMPCRSFCVERYVGIGTDACGRKSQLVRTNDGPI